MSPIHILVAEDDENIRTGLVDILESEGYKVTSARDGKEAEDLLVAEKFELVLLDIMMPEISGYDLCRYIRSQPYDTPVIMLTAKGEEIDRVVGFEVGADDYVVKPFSVRELILRIRAVLRRVSLPEPSREGGQVVFGVLRLDGQAHRVWINEQEVALTALEFKLLVTLLQRRGRVQTRDTLLSDVWGITAEVTTRTVDTHVKRLRQKLGIGGDYIETVRGVGYRFSSAPGESSR